ncbi:hypothetical protein RE476_04810 [Methanolobus mangrovi]|uniref:Uncharacterized protein n=1 Tax=Methanolobus mangrovi TaxID=3072977 RepID=A0AA51UHM7_9EURY|nr:hypothetical protein [Methanolobus mangrovi]WMW23153.1 hypothetical protein RE476_04810 [Methanolobus mangrovi]
MGTRKQNQTLVKFLDIVKEKSSIFCYDKDPRAEELIRQIIKEMRTKETLPVIRIYWNENEQNNYSDVDNVASFHVFRNFTSTLIKVEKLLSGSRHLILVADLTTLKQLQNNKPYINFISILLRKSREYNNPMISIVSEEEISIQVKTELIPYFKNEFVLKDARMKKRSDELIDIRYETSGDALYLEPYMQNDINKIKEIFSLTPEEKKELDKIVGRSIEEYRTTM